MPESGKREPHLGLWDSISLIVGIIIGVGIFEVTGESSAFKDIPGLLGFLLVWILGGIIVLMGTLCFAELASTYPRSGGEYVYLTHAFGPLIGFLYGWAQMSVIRPASITGLALVFGKYANLRYDFGEFGITIYAVLIVIFLTLINIAGVTLGKNVQNILTATKILGLAGIVLAGFYWGSSENLASSNPMPTKYWSEWLIGALIPVLWAYGGWNEAAYIAAEVKNGKRTIPLALILGTSLVMVIYLLINFSYWFALGYEGAVSKTMATDVLRKVSSDNGPVIISLLILISALGAINGMIFTTARIYAEFAQDHRLFRPLAHWSRRLRTPARSLALQGIITLGFILGVGFFKKTDDKLLDFIIDCTAVVFWGFFFLTGLSLFILRKKDPHIHRPFRVPGYPVLPLVFCGVCLYLIMGAIKESPFESLIGLGILTAGLPFYFLPQKWKKKPVEEQVPACSF